MADRFEIASDQHGTNTLYLDSTAQDPTWRQFDLYGNPRGAAPGDVPCRLPEPSRHGHTG
jgi:hypothetical protein